MIRLTRDNHRVLSAPLSRHSQNAASLATAARIVALLIVGYVGIAAMAEHFETGPAVRCVAGCEESDAMTSEDAR